VGVIVGVAYSRNKLALRCPRSYLRFFKFVGGLLALKWAWQTIFGSIDRY